MKPKLNLDSLSKRERQIMDVIFRLEKATANDIMDHLDAKTTNATVRKQLSILVDKGFLEVIPEENNLYNRYYYVSALPLDEVRKGAVEHLVDTFFKGSASKAVMALLKKEELDLSEDESELIRHLIQQEREKGR